jgi:hypothetical protein
MMTGLINWFILAQCVAKPPSDLWALWNHNLLLCTVFQNGGDMQGWTGWRVTGNGGRFSVDPQALYWTEPTGWQEEDWHTLPGL